MMCPVSSATDMNSLGPTRPRVGVVPMQQRLHDVDAVIGETQLRLVQQLELPSRDGFLEIGLESVMGQDLLVHARREELEGVAPLVLRLIHRDVGVVEQSHRLRAVDGAYRDSDARGDGDLPAADVERLLESGADVARHRLDLERAFDVLEQDGELVAAEPSDQVASANTSGEPLHDGLSSMSPASWPSVSFTVLNRSRSSSSSAIVL